MESPVRQVFFHEKIGQEHAPALHLVFPQEPVTPAEKERPGGQGGIGVDPVRPGGGFQGSAQGAGHTLALAVFVDVQPVQAAGFWVQVSKAGYLAPGLGHQSAAALEGPVPGLRVRSLWAWRPGLKLGGGIVPGVDSVDRFVKKRGQQRPVAGLVGTQGNGMGHGRNLLSFFIVCSICQFIMEVRRNAVKGFPALCVQLLPPPFRNLSAEVPPFFTSFSHCGGIIQTQQGNNTKHRKPHKFERSCFYVSRK